MQKTAVLCALLLVVAAFLLPIESTARALAGADSPLLAEVARGVVILKWMLALNGVLFALLPLLEARRGAFEPLLERGVDANRVSSARARWILGALLVLAAALRLHRLGVGLSFDEIDTYVHYARKPLGQVLSTFDSQNQHLLYSLLARLAFLAFGESAWALRLPAALLGVASLWALYRFARIVADEREALFAVAVCAVAYNHVWFSQDARGYTGLLCFTLLGSRAFLLLLAEREPRGFARAFEYAAWMALATWIHATAVFVVAAHGLVWLALLAQRRAASLGPNRWRPALAFVLAASFSLLLHALVLPQFFATLLAPTMPGAQTVWKDPAWLATEAFRGLARGVPGGAIGLVAALVVLALGLRSYLRRGGALVATFLLPTALTIAALVVSKHNLWPRMFFSSAGFYVLIAVRGVHELARLVCGTRRAPLAPRLAAAGLVLVCLASLVPTVRYAWEPKQDFEGARDFLVASLAPGEAVVTVDMTVLPYAELYTTGWTAVDNVESLRAVEASHARTWIVYTTPTRMEAAQPEISKRIRELYREERTFWGTLGGSEVIVASFPREAPAR